MYQILENVRYKMIEIEVKDIKLTLEEARELYYELDQVFGNKNLPIDRFLPIGRGYIDQPPYEWPKFSDWPEPVKITC